MVDKKYFQSAKRGELAELRDELNSQNREKQKEVRVFIFCVYKYGCRLLRKLLQL